jgi:hypothetical protein
MASVKISDLPAAAALAGDEVLPVVQNGATKRATMADVAALASANAGTFNAVASGGAWVTRDLATLSYALSFTAGSGTIDGRPVTWDAATVTTPAENALIVVNAAGTIVARAAGYPEPLPSATELVLARTYVDIPTYGARIYAVIDSRTYSTGSPRAPLGLLDRVKAAKITSGTWSGATALNDIGDINWYFANLGLYPFVEDVPTQVLDHLNIQITAFYGASGTASTDWTTLHGTTHSGYQKWPYDVATPRATPVKKRADSHDSYAATFLRLAVRYARVASGGLTWWDTNITAIQDCLYYNILLRQRNTGGGYLTETFQDATVYPYCQTMDNIEVYAGTKAALDLMTERGGAQATWAAGYSSAASNLLLGVQTMWKTTANAAGETGWMSVRWDNAAASADTNQMTRFYPDLAVGVYGEVFGVALNSASSIARERLITTLGYLDAKAPSWWRSRQYDLFPWGLLAAAAAKMGLRATAQEWLAFVQRHVALDGTGYFLIQDVGWARYVERTLSGDVL